MKSNLNKAVTATSRGIIISYTDSNKHYKIDYERDPILKDLQLNGNTFKGKSYQKRENLTQKKIFRIALYGLSVFTPEEVKKMSFLEKSKILSNQKKVQRLLDNWKQEICHRKLGSFLTTIFNLDKSPVAKYLANYPDYIDTENKNTMDFKDLKINRDMIVKKLILAGLLPHNFYELK